VREFELDSEQFLGQHQTRLTCSANRPLRSQQLRHQKFGGAGVNEKVISLKVKEISSDPAAQKEYQTRERSLLFVAATRARDVLIVTSSGNPSRFIQ